MKRDITLLESRLQKALHELEEKKAQLLQKTVNDRITPDYVSQVKKFQIIKVFVLLSSLNPSAILIQFHFIYLSLI